MHALIVDALADHWTRDGCDRERHDRLADRCRRRIARRLSALTAEGVAVIRSSTAEMSVEAALVEVVEYANPRSFVTRVNTSAELVQVLRALDVVEDLLDDPAQLGLWADDSALWRGVAVMAVES